MPSNDFLLAQWQAPSADAPPEAYRKALLQFQQLPKQHFAPISDPVAPLVQCWQQYLWPVLSQQASPPSEAWQQAFFQWCHELVDRLQRQAQVPCHGQFYAPSDKQTHALQSLTQAHLGPLAYDVASFVMHPYQRWEEPEQLDWAIRYWQLAKATSLPIAPDFSDFHVDYEYAGLYYHLSLLGRQQALSPDITSLRHRYIRQVAQRYSQCKPFLRLFDAFEGQCNHVAYTF